MSDQFYLTPGDLSLDILRKVYRKALIPLLDEATRSAIDVASNFVGDVVAKGEPVYGINTGFGKLAQHNIPVEDLAQLQENLILSHCAGVGVALSPNITRLMMVIKMNSLARGFSGVRFELVELMRGMLEQDCLPIVPAKGSVGASGDLAPLSHMAAAMMGVGEVTFNHKRMPAKEGLEKAGLTPIQLAPKEGLALINGTQTSTAIALGALFDTERMFLNTLISGSLSVDAGGGTDTPFDDRIHQIRNQPGQIDVARSLRYLLKYSELRQAHLDCEKVQDPYCLRCQPQVMGAILDNLRHCGIVLERECNAVSDNPLIFAKEGDVLSGGNFHAEPVAFVGDIIAFSIAELGSISERRVAMLIDGSISGLPHFLTENPGLNSGFMIAHVTAAALVSENKQKSHPASVDSIPTSANQEDHVSMATHGAYRLHDMLENLAQIIGIELLAACQGVDLRGPEKSSPILETAKTHIRQSIPKWEKDRYLARDLETIKNIVASGILLDITDIRDIDQSCRIG